MPNPDRIYLQPECCADHDFPGRVWCEEPEPSGPCEDGVPWTEYVRADLSPWRPWSELDPEEHGVVVAGRVFSDGVFGQVEAPVWWTGEEWIDHNADPLPRQPTHFHPLEPIPPLDPPPPENAANAPESDEDERKA